MVVNQRTKMTERAVKVVIRVRPLLSHEASKGGRSAVNVLDCGTVQVWSSRDASAFEFGSGSVIAGPGRHEELYVQTTAVLIAHLFEGYNATVLAYGQTGSGKTYSMGTLGAAHGDGVIPRAVLSIFERKAALEKAAGSASIVAVHFSLMEVYNEEARDLLAASSTKLAIRDGAAREVEVCGLSEREVGTSREVFELMRRGSQARVTGATDMNAHSSRSHMISTFRVEVRVAGEAKKTVAKLNLVDLAGSERAKRTGAIGERLKEGIGINKSLLALGNVIARLVDIQDGKPGSECHVPYRDSTLTRVLADSLGGSAIAVMIACISPNVDDADETINTLRWASRALKIRNRAATNVVHDDSASELRELRGRCFALQAANRDLRKQRDALRLALAGHVDEREAVEEDNLGTGERLSDLIEEQGDQERTPALTLVDETYVTAAEEEAYDEEEEEEAIVRGKFMEAVQTLEVELRSLERLRDEAAAELKKKQKALLSAGGVEQHKEVEALRATLRTRTMTLDAKVRQLEATRAERERLKAEMAEARSKRVELERKLRGEAAARSKDVREAELAVRRAARETAKSKAALAKLERAHELQAAVLRRKHDESIRRSVIERRRQLAKRYEPQDAALRSRLAANFAADVARSVEAGGINIQPPSLGAAEARLALRWYHAELVRLKLASLRSVRPRFSTRRSAAKPSRRPAPTGDSDSSSWVEDDDEANDSDETLAAPKKKMSKLGPCADSFEAMTVAELKDRLRAAGLKLVGRKSELVDRLREHNVVVAQYDCTRESDGELAFRKGDAITVLERSDDGWWKGRHQGNGQVGLFPANYVLAQSKIGGKQTTAESCNTEESPDQERLGKFTKNKHRIPLSSVN